MSCASFWAYSKPAFFPGVVLYLTYWFPAQRRARVNGLFMTSFAIAGAVGGPIAGLIMSRMEGVGHLANWQWLFILEGIPSLIAGIFVLLYLTFRRFDEAALIMASLPFALVGGIWFLYLQGYNLSVATGVGFIALAGVSANSAWLCCCI